MKRKFTILTAAFMLLAFLAVPLGMRGQTRATIDDVLTADSFTATNTTYTDFSGVTFDSDAVYAGNSGKTASGGIQLRSKNSNSGIVSTTSGGTINAISVVVESGSNTLDVYGKNTAYSAASDLYNSSTQGTKIGSISATGTVDLTTYVDQYEYIGLRSNNGALYLTSITITWTTSGGTNPTYTVTYDANGGTGTMTDPNSPYEFGAEVTLLENTFEAPEGKKWDSWSVKDANNQDVTVTNDKFNMPASNVTVTAQWVPDPNATQYEWVETSLSSLVSTDIFVIVGNNGSNYALSSANGTSSAPPVYAVTIADGKINTNATPVTEALKFNISGDATNGYTFYSNGSTTNYIYCTNTNNGVRVGKPNSNTTEEHSFTVTNGYLTVGFSTPRYIGIYNSSDWRCYTDYTGNIANQTFKYYKRQVASNDPVISATDPEILPYNATGGEFGYSIANPTGATLSATSNSDWITSVTVDGTNSKVTFNTSTNNTSTQRQGTITLSYNEASDKVVTITQAAAPVIYTTIPEIFAAATNIGGTESNVNVTFGNWVVSGVSGSNAFVTDNNGNGFIIYKNSHGFAVNDKLSGTVMGTPLKLYKGSAEFTNLTNTTEGLSSSNDGTITVITDKTIASLGGVNTGAVITLSNLTYDGTNLSDGNNTIKPYNTLYSSMSFSSGKTYNVTGVYQQFDETKEILPRSAGDIVEVTLTTPTITVANTTINASAASTDGTLEVFYTQIEISAGLQILWYENDGITTATYDWVDADFDNENNVYYTIDANSGEARTAYFKVYGVDADVNDVFSDLVTINQAKFVADYATLPFAFDEGKADIENTSGLTQEGLGSDYSSSPKLKFDGTGDFVILKINERPGTLTFDIKGNSFSGSTFTVQTSEDGTTYTDLATYTSFGTNGNEQLEETYDNLGENVRYIKWIYTEKVQNGGNVGLGNIRLAKYVAPIIVPAITLNSYAINAPCSATDGTLTVTYTAIETSAGVEIIWCDENGNALSDQTEYEDWILSDFATSNINTIEYTIEANDGAERKAYFKVYGLDADGNDVYSDLVTVTQAVYVPDYAILPFEFINKGKNDIENTNGLTHSGLGSDYGDDNSKLKFDNTGDNLVLKLNAMPKSITFNIKGNTFSGGTFTVQVSEDNTTYTDLTAFTDAIITGSNQTFTLLNTNENVRYIKWIYTEKVQGGGNIGLGNIYVDDEYLVRGMATISGDITLDECTIQESGKLTIESGTLNVTTSLTNQATTEAWNNLVIKDGAQMKYNSPFIGTIEKSITGYENYTGTGNGGYYLIASPVNASVNPTLVPTINNDEYQFDDVDFYGFNGQAVGQEWQNAKYNDGNGIIINALQTMAPKRGFLYARKETGVISISADNNNMFPATGTGIVADNLSNVSTTAFGKHNLIGNPYTCNAFVGRAYYRMNPAGDDFTAAAASEPIKPLEGVFIVFGETETADEVTFTTTDPTSLNAGPTNSNISINASKVVTTRGNSNDVLIDRAIVHFGEGQMLPKFMLNPDNTKLYIPQGNKDYAVVRSEARGEMPVNFKAAENGTYTIDVEAENLEVNYLHLIDNLTGMDVDLLTTPSYTFEARKSDIASRFRLVFDANTGNDETNDNFAFINNGELIVNGNGTVQVIDILGRQMFSHEVNSSFRIQNSSFAPGVYVLRLVNGNDVKTQKIVVK